MAKAVSKGRSAKSAPVKKPAAGMGDEAIQRATGKTWKQWVSTLNKAGARDMAHPAIAKWVKQNSDLNFWWSQMVTVGYELETGRRTVNQRADGFAASASKTVAVPMESLFAAWQDAKLRAKWLPDAVTIRKATPHKSIRITWKDGKTIIAVGFYPKGPGKSLVAVEHPKLKSQAEVTRVKAYWGKALDKLKAMLEA